MDDWTFFAVRTFCTVQRSKPYLVDIAHGQLLKPKECAQNGRYTLGRWLALIYCGVGKRDSTRNISKVVGLSHKIALVPNLNVRF